MGDYIIWGMEIIERNWGILNLKKTIRLPKVEWCAKADGKDLKPRKELCAKHANEEARNYS